MNNAILISPFAPEELIARLDARAADWHESRVPPELRALDYHGPKIVRRGAAFRIQWLGGPRTARLALRGQIDSRDAGRGGSEVRMRFTLTPLNWLIAIAGLALCPIGGYWLMRNMWAAIFMTGAWLALVVFGASDNAFERNALLEEVGRIAGVTAQRQPRARSGL